MLDVKFKADPKNKIFINQLHPNFMKGYIRGLKDAMLFAEGEAKKSFGKPGNLKVRSGHLRRSIRSGANKDYGWLSNNAVYAAIHEFGGTIKPKHGDYLKFQIGGQWKAVKEVTIPSRPFLAPALKDNETKIGDIILDRIYKATN